MSRLAIWVLAALTVALCGVIARESTPDTVSGVVPLAPSPIPQPPVTPNATSVGHMQAWVDAILARPVFEPARRPPPVAAGPGSASPGFPRLTGIVILPQCREAIFAVPGIARPVVVMAGSRLDGALIQTIDAGQVVIVDAAGPRVVHPAFAPTTASPAPVAGSTPFLVDFPPASSTAHASPFAGIRGLSGRPLGLVAQPDQPPPPPEGGAITTAPSLPAPAPPGGSP